MSGGRPNQVLLVGDACARLDIDFIPYGLTCDWVGGATDAVSRLQATPYAFVVVAAALPDMHGVAFVEGLLRHFDPTLAVLYGDVDAAQAQALARSPKVAFFPAAVEGVVIGHHLFQRVSSSAPPPPMHQPPPPPFSAAFSSLSPNFVSVPNFGTPASNFAAPVLGPPAGLPLSQTPGAWPQTAPLGPRPNTTMPFFAAFGGQPVPPSPMPASMFPAPAAEDRGLMAKLETIAEELGRAHGEIGSLRARVELAEGERDNAQVELQLVRRECSQLGVDLRALREQEQRLRQQLVDAHADGEQHEADVGVAQRAMAELAASLVEIDALRSRLAIQEAAHESKLRDEDTLRAKMEAAHEQTLRDRLAAQQAEHEQQRAADAERAAGNALALQAAQRAAELVRGAEQESHAALGAEQGRLAGLRLELAAERERAARQTASLNAALAAGLVGRELAPGDEDLVLHEDEAKLQFDIEIDGPPEGGDDVGVETRLASLIAAVDGEKARLQALIASLRAEMGEVQARLDDEHVSRRDTESALRNDLKEALERLHEQTLATEAQALRAADAAAAVATLQAEHTHLVHEPSNIPPPNQPDVDDAVRARTRNLLELVNALEPFTWGLQRASVFFAERDVDGGTEHVHALRLLLMTLERLRSELDRIHGAAEPGLDA